MFKKKGWLLAGASAIILAAGGISQWNTTHAKEPPQKKNQIKNIIFMIGDGMGPSYMTAHRYMKDDPNTRAVEKTSFDRHLVGAQMTYPDDHDENITDSASAATAMSSSIKTYNNAIAVDTKKNEVKTVLEAAKEKGKSTGLVATSEITHATPAAYGAHDEHRNNMNEIADDYYDELIKGKHKIDVMLGGGLKNFKRTDRDLTKEFEDDGYSYVTTKQELMKDKNKQILGLFAEGGLDKMIDRKMETPSLRDMTNEAIKRLAANKKGFFLMVEGSQIDWAGHDNDIVAAMSEMEDFDKAFQAAIDFAKKDKETLVIVTSDHSTGGFSMGADGVYNWNVEPIKAAKRTPDYMAANILAGANVEKTLEQYIDFDLTEDEVRSVMDAVASKKVDDAIEEIFNQRSFTGWTTGGHTGEDVNVYAYGPGKERFTGLMENTDQAKRIFEILNGR